MYLFNSSVKFTEHRDTSIDHAVRKKAHVFYWNLKKVPHLREGRKYAQQRQKIRGPELEKHCKAMQITA